MFAPLLALLLALRASLAAGALLLPLSLSLRPIAAAHTRHVLQVGKGAIAGLEGAAHGGLGAVQNIAQGAAHAAMRARRST